MKTIVGIIGAMSDEVSNIIALLESHNEEVYSGITFHTGRLYDKDVVVAQCGIGKVFSAVCTEIMILKYQPSLIINTGVGGALASGLNTSDIVFADRLCQHDMDTSAIGDPVGLVSGINKIYFDTDKRAVSILSEYAKAHGINYMVGTVASGDKFIAAKEDKKRITDTFGAVACEMEGASVAQVAYINNTPFAVVRAISDSADGDASMDYPTFLPIAVRISTELTLHLVKEY